MARPMAADISADPMPRDCSSGSTATGPMASTVATRSPLASSTRHGDSSSWPTTTPSAGPSGAPTATSECQPSGASRRMRSTMSASSGPVNAARLTRRTPGSSPGVSRRTRTGKGSGPGTANGVPGPVITTSAGCGGLEGLGDGA